MAKIIFRNPNEPEQPAKGVYRWYCCNGNKNLTLYIGNSGGRTKSLSSASTLKRGVMEAQRSCLTSNRGRSLDTDFIVGSALYFFRKKGFNCYWEHISDEPNQEKLFCEQYKPILQNLNGKIINKFRVSKPDNHIWYSHDSEIAERHLFEYFENHFSIYANEQNQIKK